MFLKYTIIHIRTHFKGTEMGHCFGGGFFYIYEEQGGSKMIANLIKKTHIGYPRD